MKPLHSHVFIRPIKVENKTIIIPDMGTVNQAPTCGEVVYLGLDCEEIHEGDIVMFEKGTGLIMDVEGEKLLLMREENILAVIPKK